MRSELHADAEADLVALEVRGGRRGERIGLGAVVGIAILDAAEDVVGDERFRAAESFGLWRGPRKVLLGLDLSGFRPRSRDLSGLQLKSCDLTEADLAHCDLSRANLSLSDLSGANLVEANLTGADLEGADFSGADLTGADLTRTQLSATRFFRELGDGSRLEARVEGLRLQGATGLLEDQEAFLRSRGALD